MSRKKTLPSIAKPFAHVHSMLAVVGFTESSAKEGTVYELSFRDPVTLKEYPFRVYAHTLENGMTHINLNEAAFAARGYVPDPVADAADDIMLDLAQYLENGPVKKKSASTSIEHAMNGQMAGNEEDIKRLGHVMAKMPTNAQVRENGMIPDPIQ